MPAPTSTRLRWMAAGLRALLWLAAAFWLLFGALWLVLHGWIVPRIEDFRPQLERQASQTLGVPVRIGRISARSQGLIPSFELNEVSLLDPQGRTALRLPRVVAAVSPASLWALGFEQLYIERPELDIRRAADGTLRVGGLVVSRAGPDSHGAAADWLFAQTEVVIRGGTVTWTDELRQAPPLALTGVDWVLRNARRRHLMRLDATPPAALGERFSARGIFRQPLLAGQAGDFTTWDGVLYAEADRVDLSLAGQYLSLQQLGLQSLRGEGALRTWVDVAQGAIAGGTADVAMQDLETRWAGVLEPLAFASVAGRIGGAWRADGFELRTEGLRFQTRDGVQWPGGNMVLAHTRDAAGAPLRSQLSADTLDLAALAQIANRLPLGEPVHGLIDSLAPSGRVDSLQASWRGPLEKPAEFSAKGRVSGLRLAASDAPAVAGAEPSPARPGVSGARVDFDLTHLGGQAQLTISRGSLTLPGVFEEPQLALDQLSAQLQWKVSGQRIEAQVRNLQFANADLQGQAQLSWHTSEPAPRGGSPLPAGPAPDARFPGMLDLQGSLGRGDGARVHRYLPLVVAEPARRYVRDAVVQGELSDVRFRVKGPLDQIPYANPSQGEFRVSARVRNGHLTYVPKALQAAGTAPWPALTELRGELVFNRAAMEINGASGKLGGLQMLKADARIANLHRNSAVEVAADLRGPLADALAFVNTSPVGAMTSQALASATATGPADIRLRLNLPIDTIDKSRVDGTVTLPGNDVQFTLGTPVLSQLKGTVAFSERGFSVAGAQARLLGGDIRFEGGMRPGPRATGAAESDGSVSFRGQGTLSAEGLRRAPELGVFARMASHTSGSTAYTAALGFRRGHTEISVASSLQGLALNLPAPLNKPAEATLPLRFETVLLRDAAVPGPPLQDQLSLNLGRLVALRYQRDVSGPQARVLRGGLGIGLEGDEAAPAPVAGVAANIRLDRLDIDAWETIFASASAAEPPDAAPLAGERGFQGYLPTVIALRARQVQAGGRTLNQLVLGGSREGLLWRGNLDAAELNGYVEYRQPAGAGAGQVYARLSRLNLSPGTASDVEALLTEQPQSIPALDIVVDDVELRGKKLGRVEIDAVNRGVPAARGGVREWRLNKFNVILPEAVLTATGSWAAAADPPAPPAAAAPPVAAASAAVPAAAGARPVRADAVRRRTTMNFRLDIADSGELLKRFGMGELIRRGKGKLEGEVGWSGSPLSLDYPSMSGQFNVDLASGQFVKADPGIAKLLGVLSLQSLPRRLTLDFRDVFSEGFAFDFVRGDVSIQQGQAFTNNLQMSGVNAAVLMEGSADIARETQSLKVVVVPEINAGTASLIASAINPAIGLGSFLAQMFLRRPLMQAATQEFHIDGTWTDPRITKIDRTAAAGGKAPSPSVEAR